MDLGEGMVAVVCGLPDAALTVSQLEGSRQYTLMPNTAQNPPVPVQVKLTKKPIPAQCASTEVCQETRLRSTYCQSGAQAVDGRYASVYQMAHCNVQPTSPPVHLTEFPPQRAELCPGQGNFEVGGLGSGETSFSPTRAHGSYRGAMNWSDRGAVFTPRPSHEPDAFAKSLRKYPAISPERSSEIVERLINYTQKNCTMKSQQRSPASNTRCESNHLSQPFDRRSSIEATMRAQGVYQPDIHVRPRDPEESPTRDTARKYDFESFEYKKSLFGRNCDVRYLMDMSKSVKETIKNVANYPACHTIKERNEHLAPETNIPEMLATANSVHMETQAAIPMISRDVATVPQEQPSTRNVAVALSPISSHCMDIQSKELNKKCSSKSVQTLKPIDLTLKIRKSAQTCISSIDIPQENKKKVKSSRKTKSQEELSVNDDFEKELVQLIKDLSYPDADTDYGIRNGLLKQLRKLNRTDRSDRVKIKFGKCIMDQLYSQIELKNFKRELSNELISKIKKRNVFFGNSNLTNVFRAEIDSCIGGTEENLVNELIKDWLDDIPIKSVDSMGIHIDKKQMLLNVTNKIKSLLTSKVKHGSFKSLIPEILDVIENISIEVDGRNKTYYLKRMAHNLVDKIENVYPLHVSDRKKWNQTIGLDKVLRHNSKRKTVDCQYVQPTEDELKQFVREELNAFTTKFHLKICACTAKEIELELIDILIDSIEAIRYGNEEQVRSEISTLIFDLIQISQQEAIYFANNIIYNLKDMFKETHTESNKSQTFIVLQNSLQNASMQTQNNDNITVRLSDQDIQNNLDMYTQDIVQEINEWMAKIEELSEIDAGFKQVVAHDLAGDIVDRHKYLELNHTVEGTDAEELEHLKYQIFKWVNKLVGEDSLDIIEQAPKLMQRIQNIPVPTLIKPVDTNRPGQKESSQSGKRRFSSPIENISFQAGTSKDSNTRNEKRRQSSPAAFARDNSSKFSSIQMPNDERLNATESNFQHVDPTITLKKSAYTETNMPQTIKIPQTTSLLSMRETSRQEPGNKRFSLPGSFPANEKSETASQTQQFAKNHVINSNSYTKFASPTQVTPKKYLNKPSCCYEDTPNTNKPNCCYLEPPNTNAVPTIEELNDKYDEFVKNWVQQVPISLPTEDQALEQQLRLGLYNGIWKAIIKIKMDQAVLTNHFYYQDLLDDELEDLLNCLPSTPELEKQKRALKSKLIEETTDVTDQILKTPSSYKQQLVDNVSMTFPRFTVDIAGEDANKIVEDIHKLILAEDFILFTMYNGTDQVKANIYKKRLMKHIQEYIDAIKKIYGKELKDIEFYKFKDEIMNALYKVPVPNDDTIKEEGDEVLLGLEVEQWFSDLPLYVTDSYYEILNRKRYVDTLAKKIHDMEKQKSLADCEDELRHEITRFISRLPLRTGAVGNTQFMVEELVNRLKNRPKDIIAGSGVKRKSVSFVEPHCYDEFSRNMQLCSSFSDGSNAKKAQIDQSSFMIVGGDRVDNASFPYKGQFVQNRLQNAQESPQQWFSLSETRAPPIMFSGSRAQRPDRQNGVRMENGVHFSEHTSVPLCSIFTQVPDQSQFYGEPVDERSQVRAGPSHLQPMWRPDLVGEQSMAPGPSSRQPISNEFMQSQNSLRQYQSPYTSRQPKAYISGTYPRETIPDQPWLAVPSEYPGFSSEPCSKSCRHGQSPTPTTFRPEGSTRPNGASGPSAPQQSPDMRQFTQRSFQPPLDDFSRQPMGFSTPHQNIPLPRESRPKKRTRDIERPRREAAKKRLNLEDSDDSLKEETRCRCMERVWRTCRKKKSLFCDECEMDFPPCFRYPLPYYF